MLDKLSQTTRSLIVFGGSFSPPTIAHEAIMKACLERPGFAAVWVMPSCDRLDKQMSASEADRLAMLEIVKAARFDNDTRLVVSDFELKLGSPTSTYRTYQALKQASPAVTFWFVFGNDSYHDMTTWEYGRALQASLSVLLVGRDAAPAVVTTKHPVEYLAVSVAPSVSATRARALVAVGQPTDGLISPSVRDYIDIHRLYR